MIKSFRDKETEKIFNRHFSGKLPQNIQNIARKKLIILDAVTEIEDLKRSLGNRKKNVRILASLLRREHQQYESLLHAVPSLSCKVLA